MLIDLSLNFVLSIRNKMSFKYGMGTNSYGLIQEKLQFECVVISQNTLKKDIHNTDDVLLLSIS